LQASRETSWQDSPSRKRVSNSSNYSLGSAYHISHLVNDGVQESPPSQGSETGESSNELFTDLGRANVGFKNWHPVAVTGDGHKLAGQAEMGGVWEWTSSPFTRHEGFEPMALYPAYSGTFFPIVLINKRRTYNFSGFLRRET
jgi:hypothetical protein